MRLAEIIELAQQLMSGAQIDFLDMSLWDSFKEPAEEEFQGRTLLSYFTELERGEVRLGTAGKIHRPRDARRCLEAGADFVVLGRAAILHHDFPDKTLSDHDFEPVTPPVTRDYLRSQGLGDAFVNYMAGWKGFVED